ncbi:MAG: hypothetical protein GDA43_05100 [Hormoscilla sp. SP5CHS1]|nr:hypothetical protein [Hormoscilla sp. SP12CHS1]MBC6452644.1 hypothetical protein [Hormoscilla sp. SP5CHS1]
MTSSDMFALTILTDLVRGELQIENCQLIICLWIAILEPNIFQGDRIFGDRHLPLLSQFEGRSSSLIISSITSFIEIGI